MALSDRPRSRRLLGVLLGLGVALAAVEVGFRLADLGQPDLYEQDPLVGTRLRAGMSRTWRQEGTSYVEINRHGLRDGPSVGPGRPADELRLLVLGDSFVEALQVELEETFVQRLEHLLRPAPGSDLARVEAVNMGCSGHGTAQALLRLRRDVEAYDPQLVVLCFFAGNDPADDSRELTPDAERPFFDLAPDGVELIGPDLGFWEATAARRGVVRRTLRGIKNGSAFLSWAKYEQWRREMVARRHAISRADRDVPPMRQVRLFTDPGGDAAIADARALSLALVAAFGREARAAGVEPLVLTVPLGAQVYPEQAERIRAAAPPEAQLDFDRWDRALGELCRAQGIPFLPGAEAFRDAFERDPDRLLHFQGFGHLTPEGHAVLAAALAERLSELHPALLRLPHGG